MRNVQAVAPASPSPQVQQTVSVVIPCYNYGRFLTQSVGSVLSQEGVTTDVLIIDDASTDGSVEVAQTLASSDQRIRLVEHVANKGHIATYNEGLAMVAGKYCVLLSADDLLTPGALSRATALMETDQDVGLVYGNSVSFVGPELPIPRTTTAGWSIWEGRDWIESVCKLGVNIIRSPEVVMRTSVQKRIGYYGADLPHTADLEMWLRAAAVAKIGRIRGSDQAYYRLHSDSMHQTRYGERLEDLKGRRAAFDFFFSNGGADLADHERMHSSAGQSLAEEALSLASGCYNQNATDYLLLEAYIAFASEVFPGVDSLRLRGKLRRRQQLGPKRSAVSPVPVFQNTWRRYQRAVVRNQLVSDS